MLAEGFLRLLCYREERRFASKGPRWQTDPRGAEPRRAEPSAGSLKDSSSAHLQAREPETGLNQEGLEPMQGLRAAPLGAVGLSIPAAVAQLPAAMEDCSLLTHYPDLQVAESGRMSISPLRSAVHQQDLSLLPPDCQTCPPPLTSVPDQGYLAMGHSVNISLDLPGPGPEPMSNSLLNGLLERQLEEVYMQHLTDNLARCNSHLGNSLLHGLLPPPPQGPEPGRRPRGPDSLAPSVDDDGKISYLNTHNPAPCSSNFSSPVLRISAAMTQDPETQRPP